MKGTTKRKKFHYTKWETVFNGKGVKPRHRVANTLKNVNTFILSFAAVFVLCTIAGVFINLITTVNTGYAALPMFFLITLLCIGVVCMCLYLILAIIAWLLELR